MAEKQSDLMGSAMMTVVTPLPKKETKQLMKAFRSRGITAVGAINAAIRPNGSTFAAITHIRDNDTFSRPPTDLRGNPAAHAANDAVEL